MRGTRGWQRAAIAVALVCGTLAATGAGRAHAAGAVVDVYPEPGSIAANPHTTIAVRGVAPGNIGGITVIGTQSGAHAGTWVADSDGNGASFVPATPFAPGEHVGVHTALTVRETGSADYTFTVTGPVPASTPPAAPGDDLGLGVDVGVHRVAAAAAPAAWSFASRPDLQPPKLTANPNVTGTAAGDVIALTPRGSAQYGPLLVDDHGDPVWFKPVTDFHFTTDAKIVQYNGRPALAWWEGDLNGQGHGDGQYELLDNTYHRIAIVNAANGLHADLHDFQITPENHALVLVYDHVPQNGKNVLELTVQELDIPTGNVLFEWHSLDHVPTSASAAAAPADSSTEWDYFHGNSVSLDPSDGNLLVSGRHTSTLYKVDRHTGAVIWRLGKGGDFTPSPSFADSQWFAFQHDARFRSDGDLGVFDNGSGIGPPPHAYSRGLVLHVDQVNKTVSIVRELRAPTDVLASSQGAFRDIGNGHDFVGWGSVGEMTEYDANHNAVLDLTFPQGVQSYRAVQAQWHATPSAAPDLVSARVGNTVRASVSWNGATDVATWTLYAGPDPAHLAFVSSSARTGFETTLTGVSGGAVVIAEARDAGGHVLGRSQPVVPAGTVDHSGYWLARADGTVHAFGATPYARSSIASGRGVVGVASAGSGAFWLALSDGTVLGDGTASLGSISASGLRGHGPVTAIASTPDGHGYWLLGIDGTVFPFGTATSFGTPVGKVHGYAIGVVGAPDCQGYWITATDGGVFTYGSARFAGSLGGRRLNAPVIGITANADGRGYWLVATDGGVFRFGTAQFLGSAGGRRLNARVIAMAPTVDGFGYWLVGEDGGVFTYGTARFRGSAANAGAAPVVGIAHD